MAMQIKGCQTTTGNFTNINVLILGGMRIVAVGILKSEVRLEQTKKEEEEEKKKKIELSDNICSPTKKMSKPCLIGI